MAENEEDYLDGLLKSLSEDENAQSENKDEEEEQIKFVHKISIKGLSGQTAVFCDLTDGDGIYRGVTHTLLHGFCQSVFCFLTPCEGRRFVW